MPVVEVEDFAQAYRSAYLRRLLNSAPHDGDPALPYRASGAVLQLEEFVNLPHVFVNDKFAPPLLLPIVNERSKSWRTSSLGRLPARKDDVRVVHVEGHAASAFGCPPLWTAGVSRRTLAISLAGGVVSSGGHVRCGAGRGTPVMVDRPAPVIDGGSAFADRLRRWRVEAGLTQEQLGSSPG